MDMQTDRIAELLGHRSVSAFFSKATSPYQPRMDRVSRPQVRHRAAPRSRSATPPIYVKNRSRSSSSDFEANLPIVRGCVRHGKHLVFSLDLPRCTECGRREFDPELPARVPARSQPRWIYACAKQLMDRRHHVRHERRPRLHAVPAVQLDRFGTGQSPRPPRKGARG